MNIYVTDINPALSAQALDDKKLSESIGEIAEAMSSACSIIGVWNASLHSPIRVNHPIPLWLSRSVNNFTWGYRYGKALSDEYRYRFGLEHTEEKFIRGAWSAFKNRIGVRPIQRSLSPFPNLTNRSFANKTTDECYREMFVKTIWKRTSVWTKRGPPEWYRDGV